MRKVKINGIMHRLARIKRELYAVSAEFGDVDNFLMSELEQASDRIGALIEEINEWKESL